MQNAATTTFPFDSLRDRFTRKIVIYLIPIYLFLRRKRKPWSVDINDLKKMPKGSLGNDMYLFVTKNNFTTIPRAEFHDLYHVLMGFDTTMEQELAIEFAVFGNGKTSVPYWATILYSLALYPEKWEYFRKAYLFGKNAKKFHHLNFEKLLTRNTMEMRQNIFYSPEVKRRPSVQN